MSSSMKKYKVDPSWINSLYGKGNVYGSGNTYGNNTYGNTTYGSPTWQNNTNQYTQYTVHTNPQDPHTQFIEALVQHVKTLIQDVQYAEEQKKMKDSLGFYSSLGTAANPQLRSNTITSYPFAEDSPEVRQFRSRIKSLLEWYISAVKTELDYEHFKELEELLELPTPKTQKD